MEKGDSLVLNDEDVDWWRRGVYCSGMQPKHMRHGVGLVRVRSDEMGDSEVSIARSLRTAVGRTDPMALMVIFCFVFFGKSRRMA